MKTRRFLLWVQAFVCILLCVCLSSGMIRLYTEGIRLRGDGNADAWIYTREKIGNMFLSLTPLFAAQIVLLILTLCLGIRDEKAEKAADVVLAGSWPKPEGQGKAGKWVRPALFVLAACLVMHGVFNGSMRDVFVKAVKICTECIGLG